MVIQIISDAVVRGVVVMDSFTQCSVSVILSTLCVRIVTLQQIFTVNLDIMAHGALMHRQRRASRDMGLKKSNIYIYFVKTHATTIPINYLDCGRDFSKPHLSAWKHGPRVVYHALWV